MIECRFSHVLLHYEANRLDRCAVAEFALLGEHYKVVRSTSNYVGAEWLAYVTKRRLGVIALGWTAATTQMWQTIELPWADAIAAGGLVLHDPSALARAR